MSLLHDLNEFVHRDFKRVRMDNHDLTNIVLIWTFILWLFVGMGSIAVLALMLGWGWLLLAPLWLFVAIFLNRFGKFYSRKHDCRIGW